MKQEDIKKVMSYLGSIKSERKENASRKNGKLGGRKRKKNENRITSEPPSSPIENSEEKTINLDQSNYTKNSQGEGALDVKKL